MQNVINKPVIFSKNLLFVNMSIWLRGGRWKRCYEDPYSILYRLQKIQEIEFYSVARMFQLGNQAVCNR